eukprot:gene5376-10751_t
MSSFSDLDLNCYNINTLDGRGNGLVARRFIFKDERILTDNPIAKSTTARRLEYHGNESNPTEGMIPAFQFCSVCLQLPDERYLNNTDSQSFILCRGGCQLKYCSVSCEESAYKSGHKWLCSAYHSGGIIDELNKSDQNEYVVLALAIYALIAENMLQNPEATVNACTENILNGFHSEDYCKTVHSFRCGLKEVDPDLFENLIAPAYFESHLASPMKTIQEVFSNNPTELWGKGETATLRSQEFLTSNIFQQLFIRRLYGIFAVNNLQLELLNSQNNNQSTLYGTGLYPLYSKLNHSCICNTYNNINEHYGEVVVYAARNISEDEEITTTYLHVDPTSISRRQRHNQLRKYMFKCKCILCEEEKMTKKAKKVNKNESEESNDCECGQSSDSTGSSSSDDY